MGGGGYEAHIVQCGAKVTVYYRDYSTDKDNTQHLLPSNHFRNHLLHPQLTFPNLLQFLLQALDLCFIGLDIGDWWSWTGRLQAEAKDFSKWTTWPGLALVI